MTACNPMRGRLQPYARKAATQPYAREPATLCEGGGNPSWPRLQPYVPQVRGFLVMVAAGVAGNSTHMMSSAVLALARLVYAYRGRESMLETSVRSK